MALDTPVAGTLAENASASSSLLVPYPAGVTAGDLLLLWVAVSVNTAPTNPGGAGFVSIVSGGAGTGSQSPAGRWSYKVADGSESGNVTVSMSTATSRGRMWRISGVDPAAPLEDVGAHTAAAIGGAVTHPGVTTTREGCQLWASAARNSTGATFTAVVSPFAMTEDVDDGTPYPSTQVSWLTWSGSGATGAVTFDADNSVRAAYDLFALRPAPVPFVPVPFTGAAAITRRRP